MASPQNQDISMRPVFREDHEQFREQARRFIEREIVPHLHAWEAEGIVPKSVWLKAGEAGLLCSTVPEAYGGAGGAPFVSTMRDVIGS